MKCEIIVDPQCDERVTIYTRTPSAEAEAIKRFAEEQQPPLLGYREREATPLDIETVVCILSEDDKTFALVGDERWQLRGRLYRLEQQFPQLMRINQSCLANLRQAARFEVSLGGSLMILFKNGYRDYVSRRQLKSVKERLGLL